MKTLKQFMRESELSDAIAAQEAHREKLAKMPVEKHIEKLNKTASSIYNHVRSGGNVNHARAHELISRYDSHYDALKDNHPEAHKKWLKDRGAVSHSGHDLYA